jgi:hypothetical protein
MPAPIRISQQELQEKCQTMTSYELATYFNCCISKIYKVLKEFDLVALPPAKRYTSDITKQLISEKRKEYLSNNPERHPWRSKDKFQSVPYQKVKDFFTRLNFPFIEEFDPKISGRFFSIDIALPDKMIALEINGNQHYNNDGTLKEYYQIRHDLLVANGWNVFEIHYSLCFNLDKWSDFVNLLQTSPIVKEFDYFNYVPKIKIKKEKIIKEKVIKIKPIKVVKPKVEKLVSYCSCGLIKQAKSTECKNCKYPIRKPSKEELEKIIWELPSTQLSKIYKVSDTAIKKWCRSYNINKPNRGYWQKERSKK